MVGTGVILLIAAGSAVWWNHTTDKNSAEPAGHLSGAAASHERPRPPVDVPTEKQVRGSEAAHEDPAAKAKRDAERQVVLDSLNEAATTYEAAQLPFLNRHLYDKDPEIRKAAKDAMLVLGDAGAGKLLREAARTASTEQERQELLKAADYSELPPLDISQLRELQKQGANVESGSRQTREGRERKRGVGQMRLRDGGAAPAPAPAPAPIPTPNQ